MEKDCKKEREELCLVMDEVFELRCGLTLC